MKTLFLVRHAKSDWSTEELSDIDRPLNARGFRDAHTMSKRFTSENKIPDIIFSSPATRAISTALIFCRNLNYALEKFKVDEKIYESNIETMLNIIAQIDDRHESAMIFGHNPVTTQLANALCNAGIDNVPTCGIISVQFDVFAWMNTRASGAKLISFDYPKKN